MIFPGRYSSENMKVLAIASLFYTCTLCSATCCGSKKGNNAHNDPLPTPGNENNPQDQSNGNPAQGNENGDQSQDQEAQNLPDGQATGVGQEWTTKGSPETNSQGGSLGPTNSSNGAYDGSTFSQEEPPSTTACTTHPKDVTLDICTMDEHLFNTQDSSEDRVAKKTLTPKSGIKPTEVSEGSSSIWKAEENEHAKSVVVHFDAAEKPMLATVQFLKWNNKITSRCYVKQDDGTWAWVNKNVHDERLEELKRAKNDGEPDEPKPAGPQRPVAQGQDPEPEPSSPSTPLVAAVDDTLFTAQPGIDGGVPTLKLTPKYGAQVTCIVYGSETIWSGVKSKPCFSALLYYSGGSPILATITTKDKNGKETKVYRCRDNGRWTTGNDIKHATKLCELKRSRLHGTILATME